MKMFKTVLKLPANIPVGIANNIPVDIESNIPVGIATNIPGSIATNTIMGIATNTNRWYCIIFTVDLTYKVFIVNIHYRFTRKP